MANRISIREQVRLDIAPWAPSTQAEEEKAKSWWETTKSTAFYVGDYTKKLGEWTIGQETTKNRNKIYETLNKEINSNNNTDDALLIEYCQAYGTIVYGPNLSSDLVDAMTNTFAKIEQDVFEIKYGDELTTKVNVFFELWVSIIKNAYNIDKAAIKLKLAKTFTVHSFPIQALPILNPNIATFLLSTYTFLHPQNQTQDFTGKIQPVFKDHIKLNSILTIVNYKAKILYETTISSLALRDVIRLAKICACDTLSSITDKSEALQKMTSDTDKVNSIFGFFEEAFKFIQTASNKVSSEKHSEPALNTNAPTNTNTANAAINTNVTTSTNDVTNAHVATI